MPESLPAFGFDRICDAVAEQCRMSHAEGDHEPASVTAAHDRRVEFEADLARVRSQQTQRRGKK